MTEHFPESSVFARGPSHAADNSKDENLLCVFVSVRTCSVWTGGLSRAHQPAKHTDSINCLRLSPSRPRSFFSLYLISPSLCLPVGPSADLRRGLCFSALVSRHKHAPRRAVSFILYQRNVPRPCSYVAASSEEVRRGVEGTSEEEREAVKRGGEGGSTC